MKVTELNIYPVKSMQGISVPQFTLDRFGPQWDRRWMLVSEDGGFLTQREYPRMALISARVQTGRAGEELILTAGQRDSMTVAADASAGKKKTVSIWDDHCGGVLVDEAVDTYLSDFLEVNCQLVFMPETTQRIVDLNYGSGKETVGFADGFPILLISNASLNSINAGLNQPVTMHHFRPNIVVDGCEAFAEDGWRRIKIGAVTMEVVKPCSRCVIPSINPETAEKDSAVLRVLNKKRKGPDGKVYLGQNLLYQLPIQEAPSISVGDSVELLD